METGALYSNFDPDKVVTHKNLEEFTDIFSDKNLIGRTQYGTLYRAKIPKGWNGTNDDVRYVTVKMWNTKTYYPNGRFRSVPLEYISACMKDEIRFLDLPFHQTCSSDYHNLNVARVVGYCFEDNNLGVVYDVNSFDTLHNILHDKDKFGWRNRVKVGLGLARFLQHCHVNAPQYILRNLSAAHILVDEDFNPYLVDFAMILGGDIGDRTPVDESLVPLWAHGYMDEYVFKCGLWSDKTDVYTFGIVLLELIMKYTTEGFLQAHKRKFRARTFIEKFVRAYYEKGLAETGKKEIRCCFVNGDLRLDPDFDAEDGTELTMLAVHCVENLPHHRPTMQEVVRTLEKLHVVG